MFGIISETNVINLFTWYRLLEKDRYEILELSTTTLAHGTHVKSKCTASKAGSLQELLVKLTQFKAPIYFTATENNSM